MITRTPFTCKKHFFRVCFCKSGSRSYISHRRGGVDSASQTEKNKSLAITCSCGVECRVLIFHFFVLPYSSEIRENSSTNLEYSSKSRRPSSVRSAPPPPWLPPLKVLRTGAPILFSTFFKSPQAYLYDMLRFPTAKLRDPVRSISFKRLKVPGPKAYPSSVSNQTLKRAFNITIKPHRGEVTDSRRGIYLEIVFFLTKCFSCRLFL
mgnify:CR=1 FL=1